VFCHGYFSLQFGQSAIFDKVSFDGLTPFLKGKTELCYCISLLITYTTSVVFARVDLPFFGQNLKRNLVAM
jgi:hypothetical protein